MKQYIQTYLAAILFMGTCLSSCIDLAPINYSEINPSNFPKSEEDLKALVLSCYYPLRGNWWDGIHSPSERGVMFVNDATTEILTQTWGTALFAAKFLSGNRRGNIFLLREQRTLWICQQNQPLYTCS